MRNRTVISWVFAVGLGLLGTVQYHLLQFSSRFDRFFGDRGDARGFVYFCEHWNQALQGKTNLLSPGIFYPVKGTLAYSDLLVGYALPYAVFRAAGFGMFTSVEIVVILITFLSYLACFVLLRFVLRFGLLPSGLGAMFFAFSSPKFFQTGHIQLQFVLFLPLIFICLIRFVQRAHTLSQKRAAIWLSLASVFFILQLVTAFYYAWFFVFWSVLFLLLTLLLQATRRFVFWLIKKYWRAMLAAGSVLLLGFVPFLLIYVPTVRVGTWYSYKNVALMIPEWWSFLSMGDGNYIWGWLATAVRPEPWPATWGEMMIGIGLVPTLTLLALTVYAVVLIKRHNAKRERNENKADANVAHVFLAAMILATILFYLLGFKYWDGYSPWFYVYQVFPGTGAIRAMARYVIFLTLPMSIAFAFMLDLALKSLTQRKRGFVRSALLFVTVIVAAFGVFEQFGTFTVGGTGFSVRREETYLKAMAAKLSNDCKAFYITPGNGKHNSFEYQYDAMLISILSGVPTVNASSSQFPPQWSLFRMKDPDYEDHVKDWISLHGIDGKVCRLEIGPQVGAFEPREPNPIDDPRFFVIQHFRDLQNHEVRKEEIDFWAEKIKNCGKDSRACTRPDVAKELFYFTGFAETGSFILRLYEVGLGRLPRFEEFDSDISRLRQFVKEEGLDKAKSRFAMELANRPEFTKRHGGTPDFAYEAELWKTVHLRPAGQDGPTSAVETESRAEKLRRIAENKAIVDQSFDRNFVTLLYFGYLRRDPERPGLEQWLKTLSSAKDYRHVISGFVEATEYRERFGY